MKQENTEESIEQKEVLTGNVINSPLVGTEMCIRDRIIGTGSYAPDNVVCNNDLKEFFETDDQWIRERTGIKRRHIMTDESTSYMACRAAEKAIENAGISCEKIDLIIVSTVSSNTILPSTACIVQDQLKATNALSLIHI